MSLPELELMKIDANADEMDAVNRFQEKSGRQLYPADPVRLMLSALAGLVTSLKQEVNDLYRQSFLSYARGERLDDKGVVFGVERLPEASAICTVEFILSDALEFDAIIPAGTRVAGGNYIFSTDNELSIPSGVVSGSVTATCTTAGESANGLIPGQVNKLVDPVAYVYQVSNITTSNGGSDIESDDRYRERIPDAIEALSVAGSEGAYRYLTMSAHPDIIDVSVIMPTPGDVNVYPLMSGGAIPSDEIINLIEEALNPSEARPLTDNVTVLKPTVVNYDIAMEWYVSPENAGLRTEIEEKVNKAVAEYISWQKAKVGRDISDSELMRRVLIAGASRVILTSPQYTVVDSTSVAVEGAVSAVCKGVQND